MYGLPKLVLTDIDGVWTDGGMYYGDDGNEFKKFNTIDSAGVLFLKLLNIPLGIITGENTAIVQNRARKLKIQHLFMGVQNKLEVTIELCKQLGVDLHEVAYIGDDINDIPLLQKVGLSATPFNAKEYVKKHSKWQLNSKGGDGAFREFVERILIENNELENVLNLYLTQLNFSQ